jgi:hypothetical protein
MEDDEDREEPSGDEDMIPIESEADDTQSRFTIKSKTISKKQATANS